MGQIKKALELLQEAADALQDHITEVDDDRNDPTAMAIYRFLDSTKTKAPETAEELSAEDLERFLEMEDDNNQRLRQELATQIKMYNLLASKHEHFMGWRKTSEELPALKLHEYMPDEYLQSEPVLGFVNMGKYGTANQAVYEYVQDIDTGKGRWFSIDSEHWDCGDTVTYWKPLGPDPE